ncbi:MAG TPA: DoxX family protein [Myxococcales bacterium]|jgi:putative oxidoreductase|nr:DoxX family protein [Myxococcales bacterium]
MANAFIRTRDDYAALAMRLALGIVFLAHGSQKVLGLFGGHGARATIQGFSKMGLPPAVTILVMAAEFGGGILLIIGLLTRLAAIGIGCVMVAAVLMVHSKVGFFMNWGGVQKGEGFEYHILALGLCIALLVTGGGALSVDRALSRDDGMPSPAMPRM